MRLIVARDLMTPQVLSVGEDQRLSELATFLTDHQITGVAVRNEAGQFVGVVSATDVAAATASGGDQLTRDRSRPDFYIRGWEETLAEEELEGVHLEADGVRVRDIMTPHIYSVPAGRARLRGRQDTSRCPPTSTAWSPKTRSWWGSSPHPTSWDCYSKKSRSIPGRTHQKGRS